MLNWRVNKLRSHLFIGILIGSALVSCAAAPNYSGDTASAPAPEMSADMDFAQSNEAVSNTGSNTGSSIPRQMPQLIKRANLGLAVDSIDESIDAVTAIAQQQQGDLLNLQNQTPASEYVRHTASIELRVPQANLEATLEALSALGTVQNQSLSAEDVSNQLVDFQARLRNLRRTEDMLLDIMERSGEMSEVLQVAQELSNIRASIEQIDAQLNDLQNRVAFSTISLTLEGAIANNLTERGFGTQLKDTWQGATQSMSKFTVDLMQLGIWLLVYSPYWFIPGAIAYWFLRHHRRRSVVPPTISEDS